MKLDIIEHVVGEEAYDLKLLEHFYQIHGYVNSDSDTEESNMEALDAYNAWLYSSVLKMSLKEVEDIINK